MQLPRYERKRIKRLADRFEIPQETAKEIYLKAEGDTAAAREEIRVRLIFNQLGGNHHERAAATTTFYE